MDPDEPFRDPFKEHTLKTLTESAPEVFWRGLQDRARSLYLGEYAALEEDTKLNESQKLSKLWQDRHFRMEWLLIDEATKNGLPASSRLIQRNKCMYALVSAGGVTMTQKYVPSLGELPSPARFRADLAAINEFHRGGSLLFGDEPDELFMPKNINGIILHCPAGTRFEKGHQSLGGMGFYVPDPTCKTWEVELAFAEIIAAYAPAIEQADRVNPVLRRPGNAETVSAG